MSELVYTNFSLIPDRIVIEDVAYDSCPDSWNWAGGEDALRGDTVRTLTQTRKNIVQPAINEINWYCTGGSVENPHVDPRFILSQVWNVGWSNAFMSWCMRDHLMTLYTLQKGFWLQYDDEMSRDCAALQALNADRTQFVAPTYPFAFYRKGDPDGQFSQDHIYHELRIDNILVDWVTNPYRIDHETGLVVFENSISEASIVTLKYLWRAFVRVKEISLNQLAMAQHVYTGTVVFEQLRPPLVVDRFDEYIVNEPCRVCEDGNRRTEDTGEECPDLVGPGATRQVEVDTSTWANEGNIKQYDGNYASCTMASGGLYSDQLIGYEFNLNTPDDVTKRMSKLVGNIYHDSTQLDNAKMIDLRLVYYDEVIGPNRADGIDPISQIYSFTILAEALEGYSFTWDDLHNGRLGIMVQYQSTGSTTVGVDYMELTACWDDGEEIVPGLGGCGCNQSGPPSTTITNTAFDCLFREDVVNALPYTVPTDHYIHGVEITSYITGANKGCPEPPDAVASVDIRLKLDRPGSTFSSWFSKSNQPVRICDHAYLNYLDATSDLSWGGKNDCWGKPVGAWTPAMVNQYGFELETAWVTTCNPGIESNWIQTIEYDGHAVGIGLGAGECLADFDDAWGPAGENTNRDMCCAGLTQGYLSCEQSGNIRHIFTWDGTPGEEPPFILVEVYALARAGNGDYDPAAPHTQTGDNGFGDPFIMDSSQGWGESKGTHVVEVPVINGVATVDLTMSAYAQQGPPLYIQNEPCSNALVTTSATLTSKETCSYPELQGMNVIVHHSPVCDIGPNCYQGVVVTGTWNSIFKGLSCDLAQSSDGTTNGAWTLLANTFRFPTLGSNSRIVGIKVTGEYRVTPSYVRVGNITLKAHIGSYSGARTGKTLAYPQTNEWQSFSVGSNGDFWDYGAVYAETGVTYPTATGSQLNSFFRLEMLGDNDANYIYEFRNIKVQVFYFEVCDGF